MAVLIAAVGIAFAGVKIGNGRVDRALHDNENHIRPEQPIVLRRKSIR